MDKLKLFFTYIFSVFNPKGKDGRLDFFLKSIIVIIYSITFAVLVIVLSGFILPFLIGKNFNIISYGIIQGVILASFYVLLQSIIVLRRVRDLGDSIISNLVLYNLGYICSGIGALLIAFGFSTLGMLIFSISGIFTIIWFVMNIIYLSKSGKKNIDKKV